MLRHLLLTVGFEAPDDFTDEEVVDTVQWHLGTAFQDEMPTDVSAIKFKSVVDVTLDSTFSGGST